MAQRQESECQMGNRRVSIYHLSMVCFIQSEYHLLIERIKLQQYTLLVCNKQLRNVVDVRQNFKDFVELCFPLLSDAIRSIDRLQMIIKDNNLLASQLSEILKDHFDCIHPVSVHYLCTDIEHDHALAGLHCKHPCETQFMLLLVSAYLLGPQHHWQRFWRKIYSNNPHMEFNVEHNQMLRDMIVKYKEPLILISKTSQTNMLSSVVLVLKVSNVYLPLHLYRDLQ